MLRLLDEFIYFFEMQKTIMNWPREQSAKDCPQVVFERNTAGAFLSRFTSNFVHRAEIENII